MTTVDEPETIEEYDDAITSTKRLLAETEGGLDRDLLVVRLADLAWDRSWFLRYGDDDPADAPGDLRRLIGLLEELTDGLTGLTLARYLRMLHGMALTELAEHGEGDGEAAVALLEPVLDELVRQPVAEDGSEVADWVGDNRLALAAHSLAEAHRRLGRLDRAVAVLERAITGHAPSVPVHKLLCSRLAAVRQQRWDERLAAGDHAAAAAELEAGIAACETAEAYDPAAPQNTDDPWLLGLHGELLTARAEQDDSADDARAAAALLDRAAHLMADEPDGWRFWRSAATAHRLGAPEPEALATATRCTERALTYAMPADDRLLLHADLVAVAHERGDAARLRGALADGGRALAAATDADPGLRAGIALLLAYGYFAAAGADLGEVDAPGIRLLLDAAAEHPDADGEWQAMVDYGTGVIEHYEDMLDPNRPGDGGLRRLARAAAFQNPTADFAQRLRLVLALAGQARATQDGDRRSAQAARQQADPDRPLPQRAAPDTQEPVSAADLHVVEVYSRLMERYQANDMTGAVAAAREALPALAQAPLSDEGLAFRDMVRAIATLGDPRGSVPLDIPAVEQRDGMGATVQTARAMMTATAALAQAMSRQDTARMREIADRVELLLAEVPEPDRRMRVGGATLAGQIHLEIVTLLPGATGHARRAADWFRRAMDARLVPAGDGRRRRDRVPPVGAAGDGPRGGVAPGR